MNLLSLLLVVRIISTISFSINRVKIFSIIKKFALKGYKQYFCTSNYTYDITLYSDRIFAM